jgi:hypothetical protein
MTTSKKVLAALVIASIALFQGCPAGKRLPTQEMTALAPSGGYSLLLFGCRYPDDIMNVAFLDKEGDRFHFDIYAPDYDFTVLSGVPATDALARAESFIRCNLHYERSQLREIMAPEGGVIGYEVRPLYSPLRYGALDVMNINYYLRGDSVVIYIRLDPRVEALINSQDRERNDDRR